jgi:hypothetical protein
MSSATPVLFFIKSHVRSYTKRDGTFVAEHEDKRTRKPRDDRNLDMFSDQPEPGRELQKPADKSRQPSAKGIPALHVSQIPRYLESIGLSEADSDKVLRHLKEVQAHTTRISGKPDTGDFTRAEIEEAIQAVKRSTAVSRPRRSQRDADDDREWMQKEHARLSAKKPNVPKVISKPKTSDQAWLAEEYKRLSGKQSS